MSQGERKNSGKPRWRTFPLFLVEPLVEVGSHAEIRPDNPNGKYPTYNFLKGMEVDDCLDCAKRHMMKAESPFHSDFDEETGVHHLAHVAWNCLVALHNIKTRPDLDKRHKTQVQKEQEEFLEAAKKVIEVHSPAFKKLAKAEQLEKAKENAKRHQSLSKSLDNDDWDPASWG